MGFMFCSHRIRLRHVVRMGEHDTGVAGKTWEAGGPYRLAASLTGKKKKKKESASVGD